MTTSPAQKGFTLVELAIVITIIGLLIGGILKGQEMITNARVVATVNMVKAVETATTTFRDTYRGMPGDISGDAIPGCDNRCDLSASSGRNDRMIGSPTWNMQAGQIGTGGLPTTATVASETILFWYYLAATKLIGGMDNASLLDSAAPVFGVNMPATKFGGGMLVGYSNGDTYGYRDTSGSPVDMVGNIISIVSSPTAAHNTSLDNSFVLKPVEAANIDRKMDDGRPGEGSVQAFGHANCGTTTAPTSYNEANDKKDCGLYIQITN